MWEGRKKRVISLEERNAGKNGRMSKGRRGMSTQVRKKIRGSNKGEREERTRRKKTSLTCQCTAFPPGAPTPAGPLALC